MKDNRTLKLLTLATIAGLSTIALAGQLKQTTMVSINQWKIQQSATQWTQLPQTARQSLQARLIDIMSKLPNIKVMDREDGTIQSIGGEDKYRSDRPDPAVPQEKKIIASDYIVTPELTEFNVEAKSEGVKLGPVNLQRKSTAVHVEITLRLTSSRTSAVSASTTGKGDNSVKGSFTFELGGNSLCSDASLSDDGLVGKPFRAAIEQAVPQLIKNMPAEPWKAYVAQLDDDSHTVMINSGSDNGVEVGMIFTVMKLGKPVLDPATGEVLSAGMATSIGKIRITKVEARVAVGEIVTGAGFAIGNLIKVAD